MPRVREGSEYEDLGLIAAIHEAMSTIPGLQVSQPFQEIWSHAP